MRDSLGKSISIMKWGESDLRDVGDWNLDGTVKWIDDTMIPTLSVIERLGLEVDRKKFLDRWKDNEKSLKGNRTFTEYNPYTITSRPSNRHLGINYSCT